MAKFRLVLIVFAPLLTPVPPLAPVNKVNPWMVVAPVHWAICPLVGVPTLLTLPPPVMAVHVIGADPPPPEVNTCPAVPAVIGRLKLNVPAVACGNTVIEPLVVPLSTSPVHAGLNCACAVVAKSNPTRPPRILRIIMTPPAQHPCRIHCH